MKKKFRAWVKKEQQFYYAELKMGSYILQSTHFVEKFPHSFEMLDWQQYTGLKDKNGVEIYEGDIVKGSYNNKIIQYPVLFTKSAYFIGYEYNKCVDLTSLDCLKPKEVIGNIYSNPELLDNKK